MPHDLRIEYFREEDRREEWDAFVAKEPSFSLFQSWGWGEFKCLLGWDVYRMTVVESESILAAVQVFIKKVPMGLGSVAYIPRGPVGDWMNPAITPILFAELHALARKRKALSLRLEPPLLYGDPRVEMITRMGFRVSQISNQPRSTIIIDLTLELNAIMAQMRRNQLRNLRSAIKSEIEIRQGTENDLKDFFELMELTGHRAEFSIREIDYYKNEWEIISRCYPVIFLLAYFQGTLVSAQMSFVFGQHLADFHQGSNPEFLHLNSNLLVIWETIKRAKELGCTSYDLWGIPDEIGPMYVDSGVLPPVDGRVDGLWGVYRFKSGISKNIRAYAGGFEYPYSKVFGVLSKSKFINPDTLDRLSAVFDFIRG